MGMLPALSWVEGAGTLVATRKLTAQADDRCHAQSEGSRLSWGPKSRPPFFPNELTLYRAAPERYIFLRVKKGRKCSFVLPLSIEKR